MDLLLVPKVRFHSKTVGVHQVGFCEIQEHDHANPAILPSFQVEWVFLNP